MVKTSLYLLTCYNFDVPKGTFYLMLFTIYCPLNLLMLKITKLQNKAFFFDVDANACIPQWLKEYEF